MFKRNTIICSILIILSFSLISINSISISCAQGNGDPHTIYSEFTLLQSGKTNGEMINVSSIEFSLPENWTVTNLNLNFTNIQSRREIKNIETQPVTGLLLYKGRTGMGVQLIITKPTEIYAVHIYGLENDPITTTTVFMQINGYDSGLNAPNETIYASTQVNISTEIKWHIQNFSTSVFLNPGNYYLVMNGTNMFPQDNGDYYWANNNEPENPNLYMSEWDKDLDVWLNGTTGTPFLYKLDQKIIGKFSPEDINMTVNVDGTYYPISDGVELGTGFLNESVDLLLNDHPLNIPIRHNSSINLIFNMNYSLDLISDLMCDGIGLVKEDFPNYWTITPLLERDIEYQIVQFFYPKSWYNLTVYKKIGSIWENKTSSVEIDDHTILIPNNEITGGVEWKIIANSPNLDYNLNLPVLEWHPGQELQFSVNAPYIGGNLTFFLINSIGFGYDDPIQIKEVVSEETLFYYTLPLNSREGSYNIIIYWNNNTDAGVQYQEFQVTIPPVPFTIDPIWIVIGIISAIGATTAGLISYRTIKKYRIKKIEESQKLFSKCMDVLKLDYIIISDKKSRLNVYHQKFSDKDVDAAMISGFLQAIHSFGIELIKIEDSSQTIKLEYRDSIIIMTEFVNLRLILLMKEPPSSNFFYSLEDLAYDIYKYYGDHIDEFNGNIKPFKSIEKLLKHHLNISLTYPLKIRKREKLEKVRINPSEREFINKAQSFMKMNNRDTFHLASILDEQKCSPKDLDVIFNLIEKDIFQVIE